MEVINVGYLVNAILFSLIGMGIFGVSFFVMDKLTPYNLWRELCEKNNKALAIVVAGMTVSIGLIIAAAISG